MNKVIKEIKVKSPANIAFIKYWGQKDKKNYIPYTDNFSMNLSACFTILNMQILSNPSIKKLYIKDYGTNFFKKNTDSALDKVIAYYDRTRKFFNTSKDFGFIIKSENTFPKKAGIASSASFFSALAIAFSAVFDVKMSQKQLSILARLSGSGSACRSIPDGFVWWQKGESSESSYAKTIANPDYWDLVDIVLLLTKKEKKVTSAQGHKLAETSPLFNSRVNDLKTRLRDIKEAFDQKSFNTFGKLIEDEAISMHSVMMTQNPPLYFWSGATIEIIKKTLELRAKGVDAYFTIDAGENVHIICEKKSEKQAVEYYRNQNLVKEIIVNYPSIGGRIIS